MCNYDAVPRALRLSVGDKELMAMDQLAPRETFGHVANFGVTAECNDDESDRQEEGDDAVFGVHDSWPDDDRIGRN